MHRFHAYVVALVGTLFVVLTLRASIARADLAAYWNFNEQDPSDLAGTHDLTLLGGAGYSASTPFGGGSHALSLNGTSARAVNASMPRPLSEYTYSLWLNPSASKYGSTMDSGDSRADLVYGYVTGQACPHITFDRENDGKIGIYPEINNVVQTDVKPTTNSWATATWHNLVFTSDAAGEFNVLVNGALENTVTHTGTHDASTGITLGSTYGPAFHFGGLIDEVAVWDNPLTIGQAKALYNLSQETTLQYNPQQAQRLFDLHEAGSDATTVVGGQLWEYVSGMTGSAGDVTLGAAGRAYVQLDDGGTGVTTQTLRVDLGAAGHDVQANFVDWSGTGSNTTDHDTMVFADYFGGFTAALKRGDGSVGIDWRFRAQVSGTDVDDILEDAAKRPNDFRLTFQGLAEGWYKITTFHHDASLPRGLTDVYVTDADRNDVLLFDSLQITTGTSSPDYAAPSFLFHSNGSDDVFFRFFAHGHPTGSNEVWLNGFVMARTVPEPSALGLAVLGLAGLLGLWAVRRR